MKHIVVGFFIDTVEIIEKLISDINFGNNNNGTRFQSLSFHKAPNLYSIIMFIPLAKSVADHFGVSFSHPYSSFPLHPYLSLSIP